MVGETSDFTSFLCCVLRYHYVECSLPIVVSVILLAISFMGLDGLWVV